MAGDTRMAGKVALLLWAQTLSLAGAQTTQLLVEPPWTPAVWWDRVTLTCQGSGTASATTWYKDGQRWGQEGRDHFTVTDSGTYMCDRPGSGLSPTVSVSNGWLVLQVPARTLLEGDTVTLRCRRWWDSAIGSVSFYHEKKKLGVFPNGTEMCLSPLQLHHNGRYRCKAQAGSWGWQESMPVTVTVHELFTVPVLEGPPEPTEGSSLTLSCLSTPSPLRPRAPLLHVFYRDGQVVGGPQGSPQLLVPAVGVSHSGNYSCEVQSKGGAVRKSSAWFRVRWLRGSVGPFCSCSCSWVSLWPGTGGTVWLPGRTRKGPLQIPQPPKRRGRCCTPTSWSPRGQGPLSLAVSPRATTLQDPQVTYAELRGPQGRPREPGDIYGNVL
ncbi:Fc receptor-like A isoform X6 [Motacilla alba alba]|uniref:Fc receptor-like A isoform X6 n=1 Tax=Motacilla alba alba TaxID=1094192 RepID=UPI0018D4E569|nr:Fc receptor-like A isoform X6 [Motacilla alba alba]